MIPFHQLGARGWTLGSPRLWQVPPGHCYIQKQAWQPVTLNVQVIGEKEGPADPWAREDMPSALTPHRPAWPDMTACSGLWAEPHPAFLPAGGKHSAVSQRGSQ